jgi:hypothetical protein
MHFDHAMKAWRKWGVELNSVDLENQIKYIEEFPCKSSPSKK